MRLFPSDEEQNIKSPDSKIRDLLPADWDQPADERPRPGTRELSEDEPAERVRIYEPKRSRVGKLPPTEASHAASAPASEAESLDTQRDEQPESAPRQSLLGMAKDFLSRFHPASRSSKALASEKPASPEGELPSFDELVWGKKPAPVRIAEDEDALPVQEEDPPAAETPRRARSAAPEVEVQIPDSELSGLSVDAILAEYWSGLDVSASSEEAEPPSRRRRSADLSQAASSPPRGKTDGKKAHNPKRPSRPDDEDTKAPAPVKQSLPVSGKTGTSPEQAPAQPLFRQRGTSASLRSAAEQSVEDALNMSVADILSEFWAGYTEPVEESPPRSDAPRSRREAARMREEAASVPPTGAAASAAEKKAASSRQEKQKAREQARRTQPAKEPEKAAELSFARPARKERRPGNSLPFPQEETPAADPEPPAPLDLTDSANTFCFLRRARREKSASLPKQAPPDPPRSDRVEPALTEVHRASPRRREIIDEDVEFSAMSVDDIIAEYNDILAAIPAAADAIGAERSRDASQPEGPSPEEKPSIPAESAKSAGGRVSRMEEEARGILQQMRGDSFSARKEEVKPQGGLRRSAAEPAPAGPEDPAETESAATVPNVTAADWSESLRRLLGQDPAPPQPSSAAEPSRKEERELSPAKSPRNYIPSEEIDPRFNLSGERKSTMVFGGKELDLSADESYVPPKPSGNVGFHWVAGEEELPEKPLEKKSLFRRTAKPRPVAETEDPAHTEGYNDLDRPEYAPDKDYDEEEGEDPGAFPSFGQYLSGMVSSLLVRVFGARQGQANAAGTMEDEDEELGPEVSPAAASKYYGSFVTSLRMRVRIGLVLLAVLAWITLGLPVTGALRTVQVASGLALAIQLTILLLGLDVVTGSLVNLARGRFGADSLAVLSCILTSLDALSVCLGFMGTPHMPLCLISSLSFLGVLMASLASARGLRKALRVPAIGKRCYGVTAEADIKGRGLTLLKSLRPPKGFVRRAEEAAPDESAFYRLAPILTVLALLLTLVVAIAKHAFGEALYILTVILTPAVPLMALLCFALPFLFGSLRIFHSGAAIAGWSGISDIGRSENLIVTDRDLFPEGSVEIDTVRIFAEVQPESIISYAGTMICASGSDLAPCFSQLMEKNGCPMRRVEGFEYLSGGGMKGVIDGSVILCGGLDLMRLMNVRVPYRLVGKTTVLLAVDGILCGIFNMKYEGQPQVRKALVGLIRSNRHPIFAIRDFLVTPEMLADCFDVATDGYDFPPYVDRFAISEARPTADSKLAAVVCREGLGPLVHMADTARSLFLAIRLNLVLTVLAAVLGVFVVFVKLLSAGTVSAGFLLLFLLLWSLPVLLISAFLRL